MLNALTVDVEDYFHVTAFEKQVQRSRWADYPLRVVENTQKSLDIFDEFNVKGTFFILGWVAQQAPSLIREISRRGHEIACHGFGHELIFRIGPTRFRDDVRLAKSILEDICGAPVNGYRAPSYSITKESLWAFDILVEEGFIYDSSVFPIVHDIYGIPGANRFPHLIATSSGSLVEFPLSTFPMKFAKKEARWPVSGGGYLRIFPVYLIRKAIEYINRKEQRPTVLYFHPWELDSAQPRIKAGIRSRFRHYTNLHRTEKKLRYLMQAFNYSTMRTVIDRYPDLQTF